MAKLLGLTRKIGGKVRGRGNSFGGRVKRRGMKGRGNSFGGRARRMKGRGAKWNWVKDKFKKAVSFGKKALPIAKEIYSAGKHYAPKVAAAHSAIRGAAKGKDTFNAIKSAIPLASQIGKHAIGIGKMVGSGARRHSQLMKIHHMMKVGGMMRKPRKMGMKGRGAIVPGPLP